jgi:hypothetical protein
VNLQVNPKDGVTFGVNCVVVWVGRCKAFAFVKKHFCLLVPYSTAIGGAAHIVVSSHSSSL